LAEDVVQHIVDGPGKATGRCRGGRNFSEGLIWLGRHVDIQGCRSTVGKKL